MQPIKTNIIIHWNERLWKLSLAAHKHCDMDSHYHFIFPNPYHNGYVCIKKISSFCCGENSLKLGFELHLFYRRVVENKMVNAEQEKSSLPATVASTMKYVSLAFVIVPWIRSSYGNLTFA